MNEITENSGRRITLREIAEITGAAYSTIAAYAQKAGWTENGKQTLLDERQATIILEAMKQRETGAAFHKRENGSTFHNDIEGINTAQSRAVRIAVLAEKRLEIERQFNAELEAEIAELRIENHNLKADFGQEVIDHRKTKSLLTDRETGLEIIQRIAESGGLITSDRDDVLAAYGRKRR